MRKKFLIVITVFFHAISFSQTSDTANLKIPDWIEIAVKDPNAKYYAKSEIIAKDENGIKIWTKIEYRSTTINKKIYKNAIMMNLIIISCDRKQYKRIRSIYYNSVGAILKEIYFNDQQKWQDVIPETPGEGVVKYVCEMFN